MFNLFSKSDHFSAAKGITPSTPSDYVPVTKSTVTYIVLAILVNEDDEFLMMQEAKSSCAGQWYLPAGRIEPGENIVVINSCVLLAYIIIYAALFLLSPLRF